MDKKVLTLGFLLCLIGVGMIVYHFTATGKADTETKYTYVTVYDTLKYYEPVPKDSVVIRYETKVLPLSKDTTNAVWDSTTQLSDESDSVAVDIPITQKKYETEDYRAYVSGYEPNLDSIFIRNKTTIETITITEKAKKNFWKDRVGFGIVAGGGYGLIHKQPDLFVGGAVYIKIW